MYYKPVLGLDECQAAMKAMLDYYKNLEGENPPIAAAIVDETGLLLSYARTDGCGPVLAKNAIKKAYTAALRGVNTAEYAQGLKEQGRTVAEFGDPMLLAIPGGVVVKDPKSGTVMGGIGVAGLPPGPGDDNVAEAGLQAMGLK